MSDDLRLDVQWEDAGDQGVEHHLELRARLAPLGFHHESSSTTVGTGRADAEWHSRCELPRESLAEAFAVVGELLQAWGVLGACAASELDSD